MTAIEKNPLISAGQLPQFSRICPAHTKPALDHLLSEARRTIASVSDFTGEHHWDSLAKPMEELDERLSRAWAPISHLHAVADNPQLREAYNECLPKLSEYTVELAQNEPLFKGYTSIAESTQFVALSQAQKKTIQNALRNFRLAGVDLAPDQKQRYKFVTARLSELSSKFNENVLDATQGWKKHISDPNELSGLPSSTWEFARAIAEREGLEGWVLTLEAPCYVPVMTYADSAALRYEMYEASTTMASDQGPNAGRWDNSQVMEEILTLRNEQATLLGFTNFAEFSLATKMARDTDEVLAFLNNLVQCAKPVAETELAELKEYVATHHAIDPLETWDIPYYSEKLRAYRYQISQEELRPYFPIDRVLDGLFVVANRLFGLTIKQLPEADVWDQQVNLYSIYDANDVLRGQFYLDLYSRPNKRGGAWMGECVARKLNGETVQTPVAFIVCNFTPPTGDKLAQITHDEVLTLFHEFGHGLHHMLTLVDYSSVSGINGVAWDAVELPSQLMENWCWEAQTIGLISRHQDTGETLPTALFERALSAKNFQAGMKMIRQLEFALFDFQVHLEVPPRQDRRVQEILTRVRRDVAVVSPPAFNRFAHSFSHIFGGGYAAGYYSYLWAEVLSSDAFALFEETGVFARKTGLEFLHSVLEQGGAREAMDLFVEFRGREPNIEALLRYSGINREANRERNV